MDPELGMTLAFTLTATINFIIGWRLGVWSKQKELRKLNADQFEMMNQQLAEIRRDSLETREQIADLTLMLDDRDRTPLRQGE